MVATRVEGLGRSEASFLPAGPCLVWNWNGERVVLGGVGRDGPGDLSHEV